MSKAATDAYVLPAALIGRADLSRLVREVEAVDNDIEAQRVRGAEQTGYHLPTMSRSLSDFLQLNKIEITDDQSRMKLTEGLRQLKDKAPIMHMTFAIEADPEALQQLVTWIRTEIHPHALLSVGIQPRLVGGVYLRTPNHVHDFSLRSFMKDKRSIMIDDLEALHAR